MKILITHVYSQHNKGDVAILMATIDQLKKEFPNAKVSILTGEKITKDLNYRNLTVLNAFFYFYIYKHKNSFLRILNTISILSMTTFWALLNRFVNFNFLPSAIQKTCNAYRNAHLIVPVGGGYISGKNNLQSTVTLIIQLHAVLIGELLQKKTILYSQSIGPFSNGFQKTLSRFVLNNVTAIFAREDNTVKTLKEIGIKENLIFRTVDAAFAFKSSKKQQMKKALARLGIESSKPLVGITVRKWLKGTKQERFEKEMAEFVEYLQIKKIQIIFIPQVTSELHNDDDRLVNNRIINHLSNTKNVYSLDKKYSAEEIKGIYENMDFLVGTRMHSIIFSLTGGIPCLAIEYEYKTGGIMRDLGLSDYVIKIQDVSSKKLITLFTKLQKNKKEYRVTLSNTLKIYQDRLKKTGKYIKEIYNQNPKEQSSKFQFIDKDNVLSYVRKPAYVTHFYATHPTVFVKNANKNFRAKKISRTLEKSDKVSIIIVTYNALEYIKLCLRSLNKTNYKNKEVIVVDNNSNPEVQEYLKKAEKKKLIDKLFLSPKNTFFTGGNNIGAKLASIDSKYLLFLNSDVEIRNPEWLKILMANKPKKGIISFGKVDIPVIRPDGWCFMVDKKIFEEQEGLNEYYKMNWSITEFTARVLKAGYTVKSIVNPNEYVYHFGQKSRPKKNTHKFNEMKIPQVINLFKGKRVNLLKA